MVVFYYSVPTYLICSPPVISVILHQGSQSAAEYSIDFRILAAESGWNLAPSPARYPTLCQHPKASHIRPDSRELFPPPPPCCVSSQLCLYCGQPRHYLAFCPALPKGQDRHWKRALWWARLPQIPAPFFASTYLGPSCGDLSQSSFIIFVDYGADNNFIDSTLVEQKQFPLRPSTPPRQ